MLEKHLKELVQIACDEYGYKIMSGNCIFDNCEINNLYNLIMAEVYELYEN